MCLRQMVNEVNESMTVSTCFGTRDFSDMAPSFRCSRQFGLWGIVIVKDVRTEFGR
jgi:hypothetical protein